MNDFNLNALWCRILIEELLHGRVSQFVCCPGGRLGALAAVLCNHFNIEVIIHGDERSAAFIALGLARSSHAPVGICTTAGSAVANLMPALCEAYATNTPLILLTCDRPHTQRNAGMPQTTNHIGICQALVKKSIDLPDPSNQERCLLSLRRTINEVASFLLNPANLGPVQINIPMLAQDCTTEIDPDWKVPACSQLALYGKHNTAKKPIPFMPININKPTNPIDLQTVKQRLSLHAGMKGLIIVGCHNIPLTHHQINLLAKKTKFPVLADVGSGLRRPAMCNLIPNADALVMGHIKASQPDLIIRIGDAPIANTLHNYIKMQACPILRLDTNHISKDFLHTNFVAIQNPTQNMLAALMDCLSPGDTQWLSSWQELADSAENNIEHFIKITEWSDVVAANLICNNDQFDFLHIANSLSIRLGNLLCQPTQGSQPIYANRGVNGIDGTLGTFLGELLGSRKKGMLLIGDQAMLHDLPALTSAKKYSMNGCICILQNSGNALFDLLPLAKQPNYTKLIRNPTEIHFSEIAKGFGLNYQAVYNASELSSSLKHSTDAQGIDIIEMFVPPHKTAATFKELYRTIAETISSVVC